MKYLFFATRSRAYSNIKEREGGGGGGGGEKEEEKGKEEDREFSDVQKLFTFFHLVSHYKRISSGLF